MDKTTSRVKFQVGFTNRSLTAMLNEEIKKAFQELEGTGFNISNPQLRAMMSAVDCKFGRGKSSFAALRQSLLSEASDNIGLSAENAKQFRKFFYETALGRSLRIPNPQSDRPHNNVIDALLKPSADSQQFAGLWFLIHGSYRVDKHMAVHLLKVTYSQDEVLDVTDTIRDTLAFSTGCPTLISRGAMTLFNKLPQIITYGDENRIGFSLFVGGEEPNKGSRTDLGLRWIYGTLTGMTKKDYAPFTRKALLIKWADISETSGSDPRYEKTSALMHNLTGIYSRRQINDPAVLGQSGESKAVTKGFKALKMWNDRQKISDPMKST